jgi:hypothetical protein
MEWYTEWHRRKESVGGGGKEAADAGAAVSISELVEAREGKGGAEARGRRRGGGGEGAEARGHDAKTPERALGNDITPKPTWSKPAWYSMVLAQRQMNAGF